MSLITVNSSELQKVDEVKDMEFLYEHYPSAIVAGLVSHFYRHQVVEWLLSFFDKDRASEMALRLGSKRSILDTDMHWALAAATSASLAAISDLDRSIIDTPEHQQLLELRNFLLEHLALRGLLLCPVRRALEPISELMLQMPPVTQNQGPRGRWCAAVKAHDGSLYFLPRDGARHLFALFVVPHSGESCLIDLHEYLHNVDNKAMQEFLANCDEPRETIISAFNGW